MSSRDYIGQIKVANGSVSVRHYYLKDHLGTIRETIDKSDNVVAAQDYYSYGEYIRSYNQGLPNDRYKFTSKERDNETNLDYFGARYYESSSGRWLSVDPLTDKYPGWSSYNYVEDDPIKMLDLLGLSGIVFNKVMHTITLYDKNDKEIGQWSAYNNVDHRASGTLPKNGLESGTYNFFDTNMPHTHGNAKQGRLKEDSENGEYGPYGIYNA